MLFGGILEFVPRNYRGCRQTVIYSFKKKFNEEKD